MGSVRFKESRLEREYQTVGAMIGIYCRRVHRTSRGLCDECSRLLSYAEKRLEKCPYQSGKPACSGCPVHCYQPEMRERIREVMRFAGPMMIWHHPILSILHLSDRWRTIRM